MHLPFVSEQEYSKMNYLDILVRASIDVAAAAENIKLPNAGTQVSGFPTFTRFRAQQAHGMCDQL